jgi:cytochrome c oxidase subunit 1
MKRTTCRSIGLAGLAFCLGLAQMLFMFNFFWSLWKGAPAGNNPWQANTLEWATSSPPPHGNFAKTPTVYHGPYEYSRPDLAEDWLPQHVPTPNTAAHA